jgi:hypothetical protein
MIGERKETNQQNYGTLVMRPYDIAGNSISAFYDSDDDLVFVLDNTINASKPNVLLVINPDADKKWDEILSHDYDVDLETIRPKQDNKYQKLDIEYSGLAVYDNLIKAYIAGEDMTDSLVQLNVLRDSAARHSAMMRLDVANETISKTNATIVKTKESIIRLQNRIKTLRAKLTATKKEIGKVSTKQSAAKILRLESQIEATNEKLKRAKKRLESAQHRLETATVDAELASDLLNQPPLEIEATSKPEKSVIVAPKHELVPQDVETETLKEPEESEDDNTFDEDDSVNDTDDTDEDSNSDVKPLFEKDPEILNEDIAFKPISFDVPITNIPDDIVEEPVPVMPIEQEKSVMETFVPVEAEPQPVIETFTPVESEPVVREETAPVLETMTPVVNQQDIDEQPVQETDDMPDVPPVVPITPTVPVPPVVPPKPTIQETVGKTKTTGKSSVLYYVLLSVLILLSIFTLWIYQKNVKTSSPMLTADTETVEQTAPVVEPKEIVEQPVVEEPKQPEIQEDAFLDVVEEPVVEEKNTVEPEEIVEQPVVEEPEPVVAEQPVVEAQQDIVPEVIDDVPARVIAPVQTTEETKKVLTEEEILARKPAYEPGNKYDEMFVDEQYYPEPPVVSESQNQVVINEPEIVYEETDVNQDTGFIPEIITSEVIESDDSYYEMTPGYEE